MSIEKRAGPTQAFFASARAIDIKVLKDLKRTRDVFSVARCMARDRPSPYGEGKAGSTTVARGPVPRDRWRTVFFFIVARGPRMPPAHASGFPASVGAIVAWRGTDPRPTVRGRIFASLLHRDQEVSPTGSCHQTLRANTKECPQQRDERRAR